MGKRATNKDAKSPKKAKVSQAPEAPVLTAIDALSIPASARDMLKNSLPYCLADKEKHPFQAEVLDSIQRLFQGVDQEKVKHVSDLEAKLLDAQSEKDKKNAEIAAKKEEVANKKKECDEKSAAVDAASDAVDAAKKAFEEAKGKAEEFDGKKKLLTTDQESFDKITKESWPPLKDGTFASNEWRKRNKAISELKQALLTQVKMEESLLDALEVTFKIKPDQRDAFANLSLEYAEDACKAWGEKIAKEMAALDEEGLTHKKAIEAAMGDLQEKEKCKQLAETELETEQNLWVDMENTTYGMIDNSRRFDIGLEEASAEVESAKGELKEFRDTCSLFASLIDPPAAAVEPEPLESKPVDATDEVPIAVEAS